MAIVVKLSSQNFVNTLSPFQPTGRNALVASIIFGLITFLGELCLYYFPGHRKKYPKYFLGLFLGLYLLCIKFPKLGHSLSFVGIVVSIIAAALLILAWFIAFLLFGPSEPPTEKKKVLHKK